MLCPFCLVDAERFEEFETDGVGAERCPRSECGHTLPPGFTREHERYPPIVFSLIGLSGHGKTCYLASLLQQLEHVGAWWKDFSYTPLDENTMTEVQGKLKALQDGQLPDPTMAFFPEPAILRIEGIPQVGDIQAFVFDNGGEVFIDVMRLREFASYLTRSPTVVWMVSLRDLAQPAELLQLLRVYREALLTLKADPSRQSLLVVLTKADELIDLQDEAAPESVRAVLREDHPPEHGYDGDLMERLSRDIERWLEESADQHNFVRQARRTFARVKFCITSALGASPTGRELGSQVSPRGVLMPLYWLARFQLPRVVVRTEQREQTFGSLEQAVAAAPAGARIELSEGAHRLSRPLLIRRPLTLIGAGLDRTFVGGVSSGFVIKVEGVERFEAEGITFEHKGTAAANVLVVSADALQLRHCRFRGAVHARTGENGQTKSQGGVGLKISGATRGLVHDCEATANSMSGIQIDQRAKLVVERNVFSENGRAGATFIGRSGGEFRKNVANKNGQLGVCIAQDAHPKLIENQCEGNAAFGIIILQQAAPELVGNRCHRNGTGICFGESSGGTAARNDCEENLGHGILVRGDARPVLDTNQALGNAKHGLAFEAKAGGTARGNLCRKNGGDGIQVRHEASPELVANHCERGGGSGIAYLGAAAGLALENHCEENGLHGISVSDQAQPTLRGNSCSANAGSGLVYQSGARGIAQANRCANNRLYGIHLQGGSAAVLAENLVETNQAGDLKRDGESAPPPIPDRARWSFFRPAGR